MLVDQTIPLANEPQWQLQVDSTNPGNPSADDRNCDLAGSQSAQVPKAVDDAAVARELSSEEFRRVSASHGLILDGAAGANLESMHSLIFFADLDSLGSKPPTSLPVERIKRIQLVEDEPISNTPLNLPSLWRVRIELEPTASKNAFLETVFES
jgi:hypothetical protein